MRRITVRYKACQQGWKLTYYRLPIFFSFDCWSTSASNDKPSYNYTAQFRCRHDVFVLFIRLDEERVFFWDEFKASKVKQIVVIFQRWKIDSKSHAPRINTCWKINIPQHKIIISDPHRFKWTNHILLRPYKLVLIKTQRTFGITKYPPEKQPKRKELQWGVNKKTHNLLRR